MKRSDTSNAAAVDATLLDAKGKVVLLECYPDGEILFWSDDGIHLEFDRRHAGLILAALRKQEKLPKVHRETAPVQSSPQRAKITPSPARTESAIRAAPQANRRVAKEGPGWGATVLSGNKAVRYFYDKRDQARDANPAHRVGEAGRIA